MKCRELILLCVILSIGLAEPDPKKYKQESKKNEQDSNLTAEERTFLREVETKFGIKSDVPLPTKEITKEDETTVDKEKEHLKIPGFPAVIAIEIVNDTDTKTKGKRTIDANLGYGYRTNNGYMYSYFGKPSQEKGKFMIYPYSQQDIPPARDSHYKDNNAEHSHTAPSRNRHGSHSVVEIQPSQAFELVPVKEGEDSGESYQYKHEIDYNTNYDNIKGLQSPPPPYSDNTDSVQSTGTPSTLYTTYNGQQFSGLQGQFPMVMSNYLVDPSQLLQNPQYQSAGLTQDHLKSHGSQLEQRVVPVLVLRIPSSYLKNPSAELYANLPQNYPLSQYLNNVNLQSLVNQYFKKIGYPYAPQIMPYPTGAVQEQQQQHVASAVTQYEPQHYSNPYVRPAYTHADYSGVQYSAVQPVMAKYPTHSYAKQQYYISRPQPQRRPQFGQRQQQYEYQYVQQPAAQSQAAHYTVEQQYETAQYQAPYTPSAESHEENTSAEVQTTLQDVSGIAEQAVSQETTSQEEPKVSTEYDLSKLQRTNQHYVMVNSGPDYESKSEHTEYIPKNVNTESHQNYEQAYQEHEGSPASAYSHADQHQHQQSYVHYAKQVVQPQTDHLRQPIQKETVAIYPSYSRHSSPKYSTYHQQPTNDQSYLYQKSANIETETQAVVISENYPSKDHTQAVPYRYSKPAGPSSPVQTVKYVTPLPYTAAKYQTQYKVMVPQTALKTDEKVSYVNSHSLPMHYLQNGPNPEYNSEEEYSSSQYLPPVASQKGSSYPKNYHSHPKRMTKNYDNKTDTTKKEKKSSPEEKSEVKPKKSS